MVTASATSATSNSRPAWSARKTEVLSAWAAASRNNRARSVQANSAVTVTISAMPSRPSPATSLLRGMWARKGRGLEGDGADGINDSFAIGDRPLPMGSSDRDAVCHRQANTATRGHVSAYPVTAALSAGDANQ